MKILLIEDILNSTLTLKDQLSQWFVVDILSTRVDCENVARLKSYDLLIIDSSLPSRRSGLEVCQALRQSGVTAPILMLSANRSVHLSIQALNLGCDDYVIKPFLFEELLARVRALLRRTPALVTRDFLRVGELNLDITNMLATRQQHLIPLRRKESRLLEYLMRNPNRVIGRDMILEHVWDHRSDTVTNIVDVHIKHLRAKIDRPFSRQMIKTIHGLGYRLDP